jgi:hypothetical protein
MCYLSKKLQNTSHFVTLFSAHGDIVVYLIPKRKEKREKEEEKRYSSMLCECWWAPDGIG